jgi:toxin ParE1/3/4
VWTEGAGRDLEEIAAYIRREAPSTAQTVRARLARAAQRLTSHPARGRIVPELREFGIDLWRELIVDPYRILYRIEAERVVVSMVIDGRRDLEHLLLERLIGYER